MTRRGPAEGADAVAAPTIDPAAAAVPPVEGAGNHRQRLLDGLAASIRERGYAETTLADIVRHARTSRRTFYEYFPTKLACLLALMEAANARIVHEISAAMDPRADIEVQVRQAILAWLRVVQADPPLTLSWIREVPTLGDEVRHLERQFAENFVSLIRYLTGTAEFREAGVAPPSREHVIMLVGGLRQLIASTVEDGRDVAEIAEPAIDFTLAVLGPRQPTH
jgi:AcrR family transcriptional regulator